MSITSTEREPIRDCLGTPVVVLRLTESFDEVVALNPHLRLEQNAAGELVIMTPTGGESGARNIELTYQLKHWVKANGGIAFDSSTLFCLPSGAKRSPDASWISTERWSKLSKEDRKRYPPICPDFVVELRSETDRVTDLMAKMQEYLDNGAQLGWLIDPLTRQVHVYQRSKEIQILKEVDMIAADSCLPGFILDMRPIWAEA
ncbi:MAG: Uma2 family endonuclease [Pirellulaceae bacterium]|nr:Uma2 family endonuclease [Pirellulaceae bacterium]